MFLAARVWRSASWKTSSSLGASGAWGSQSIFSNSNDEAPGFSSASATSGSGSQRKIGGKGSKTSSHGTGRATGEGFDAADPWGVLPTLARLEALLGPKSMPPTARVAIIGNQSAGTSIISISHFIVFHPHAADSYHLTGWGSR